MLHPAKMCVVTNLRMCVKKSDDK